MKGNTLKKYDGGYTIIDNNILKNTKLSPKAIGIWVQLLSLPNDWNFSKKGLTGIINIGERGLDAGLKELTDANLFYIRKRKPTADKPYLHYDYTVYQTTSKERIDEQKRLENIDFLEGYQDIQNVGVQNVGVQNVDLQNSDSYKLNNNQLNNNKLNSDKKESKEKIESEKLYNEFANICTSLPKPKNLSDKRKKAIGKILKEYSTDDVIEVYRLTEKSDWLSGRNDKGWNASFDWIFNPTNFIKVLEGNYTNKQNSDPNAINTDFASNDKWDRIAREEEERLNGKCI